jgi:GT2 family glycosyltransferase
VRHKLSIVIVSYNAREYLARCLASIDRYPPPFPYEVIVVDNTSQDGSPEMVRSQFPHVRLLANPDNRGYGPAGNQGWRAGDSEYVLLMNSDVEVTPGSLQGVVEALDKRPHAGVLVPLFVDGRGEVIQMSWGWKPLFWGEILQRQLTPRALEGGGWRRRLVQWLQRRERTAEIVCGAAMTFRRQALEQIGGMDEDYVLYLEDSDVCARLWKAGWQAVFWPHATMVHHLGKSSAAQPGKIALLYRQSQLLFYRKHGSLLDRALVQLYLRLKFWRIYFLPRDPERREFYQRLRRVLAEREKVTF